jgi:hypothetical protein
MKKWMCTLCNNEIELKPKFLSISKLFPFCGNDCHDKWMLVCRGEIITFMLLIITCIALRVIEHSII